MHALHGSLCASISSPTMTPCRVNPHQHPHQRLPHPTHLITTILAAFWPKRWTAATAANHAAVADALAAAVAATRRRSAVTATEDMRCPCRYAGEA